MATLTPSSEDTRIYELCVLIAYPLTQKEEQEALKRVEELFEEAGAKQVSNDIWGRRGLAYKIKGFEEGSFVVYYWDLDPSKLRDIERQLLILPNVLRHLVVKPPKGYEMVDYSKQFDAWKKEKVVAEEGKAKEHEERLRQKMLDKQKRQTKPRATKKVEEEIPKEAAAPMEKEELTSEIDKLISGDELEI